MKKRFTIQQRVLDSLCLFLCAAMTVYTAIMFFQMPDMIPMNYDFQGNVTRFSDKSNIFVLLGLLILMTGTFSILVRIKGLYKTINLPWTVPWGKMPLVVNVTKDFLCWTNLLITADNAYLLYGTIQGNLIVGLIWIPYGLLVPLLIWYLLRIRRICKG